MSQTDRSVHEFVQRNIMGEWGHQQDEWDMVQRQLKAALVESDDLPAPVRRVAGVDISFSKCTSDMAVAALCVYDTVDRTFVYERYDFVKLSCPYIPGYLAFREVEHLAHLLDELKASEPAMYPDVVLVDGNGAMVPSGFGLACHLGVLCGVPTVGCAKNLFEFDGLDKTRVREQCRSAFGRPGDRVYLQGASGRVWGAAVKSSAGADDPLFVSVGHRVSLDTAIDIVCRCSVYRIPEPVRRADKMGREIVKEFDRVGDVFDVVEFVKRLGKK